MSFASRGARWLMLLACPLMAQTTAPKAKEPVAAPGKLDVHGGLRWRTENWDWFGEPAERKYTFNALQFRLSIGQQRESWDWNLEFEAPLLFNLPQQAQGAGALGQYGAGPAYFAANDRQQNVGSIFAKQGYIRLKHLPGKLPQALRIGRFEFSDGGEMAPKNATLAALKLTRINQRLIGPFGWTHVGRSFDGLHYTAEIGKANLTVMSAVPTRGVFQADGWGQVKTPLTYAAFTRPVQHGRYQAEWRAFGMYYTDLRDVVKTDNRALRVRQAELTDRIQIGTFGGHLLQAYETKAGTFDAVGWLALQAGNWGALKHRAWSGVVEGGFQPRILPRLKPWLRAGVTQGSGDKNAADGTHGTFFQVLPTPRPFARTPFYNMSNTLDRYALVSVKPRKNLTVGAEFHSVRLSNANDLWYGGGGAFQPWTFGYAGRPSGGARSLANLFDISVDYTINKHYAVGGYFGRTIGRQVTQSIYGNSPNGRLGYLEFSYRF